MAKRSNGAYKIGVVGGIIGIIIGVLSFLFDSIVTLVHLFHNVPVNSFVSAILGVVFGVFAIVFSSTAKKDSIIGGILLIIIAVLGFYFVEGLYAISSIIVLIAGIVALVDYAR